MMAILVVLLAGCGGSPAPSKTDGSQASAPAAGAPDAAGSPGERGDLADVPEDLVTAKILAPWTGDFDGMAKRRLIRALVVYSKTFYFVDRGDQRGVSVDAIREFETAINQKLKTKALKVQVAIIPVRRDQMLTYLVEGRGDVALGNLTITPGRRKMVDFSDPAMTEVREIVVTGPSGPALQKLEDLAGKEVWVRASSSYWEHLQAANAGLRQAGRPEIKVRPADEQLEDEDILEMVNAGLLPATVVDDHLAKFWARIYPDIRPHEDIAVSTGGEIAWAFRKGSPKLAAELNAFVRTHKIGTLFGNMILQRYLQDTKWVTNASSEGELRKFRATVGLFKKYAAEYDFDWLLVAAQGYQESRLDQNVRSPVGAIGVMQVMPTTAKSPEVGIPDIHKVDRNIQAGVKYMRFMMDEYFKDAPMDRVNKALFAFASYNAGPARIARLRKEAASAGLDPNKWFNNVEVIAAKRIGRETVTYVSNIYKYYLAYKLVMAQMQERQQIKETRGKS